MVVRDEPHGGSIQDPEAAASSILQASAWQDWGASARCRCSANELIGSHPACAPICRRRIVGAVHAQLIKIYSVRQAQQRKHVYSRVERALDPFLCANTLEDFAPRWRTGIAVRCESILSAILLHCGRSGDRLQGIPPGHGFASIWPGQRRLHPVDLQQEIQSLTIPCAIRAAIVRKRSKTAGANPHQGLPRPPSGESDLRSPGP